MSSPSINYPTSPLAQWLSNDDGSAVARKGGDGEVSGHREQIEPEARTAIGDDDRLPLPMNFPVDENLFDSTPAQPLANSTAVEDEEAYQEPGPEELLPPSDFRPFFTLIEDPETSEHHHPTVHYVFSDDDTEILTSAALEAIDADEDGSHSTPHLGDVEERYMILDMAPDGKTVVSASSLSPNWQALLTTTRLAPSWGDDSTGGDRGLMLKISGKESKTHGVSKHKKRLLAQGGNLDDLLDAFSQQLQGLDEVLGRNQATRDEPGTTTQSE